MTRRWWILYSVVLTLWAIFCGIAFGAPEVEERFFPVRIDQVVTEPTRDGHRLCWTWSSTKVRNLASDDIDVYLFSHGDRSVGYVFRESDGAPWSRPAVTQLGRTDQRWCTVLPPFLGADEVRVEWRAWYPGTVPFTRVRLLLPPVISTGA